MGQALACRGTRKLKIILAGLVVLMVSGCGLPMPLSYLSYGWTAYDTHQIIHGDETVTDAALSMATNMDCKILNAFEDGGACQKSRMK
jgi:FtsH-binding integral membrane protein